MPGLALDQPIGSMTIGDLKDMMIEVVREERRQGYYIDGEGRLVFLSEGGYADYLEKQGGKLPSEVRAYFIDEQGYRAFYSDWTPIPEYARELSEARREIAMGNSHAFEDVIEELCLGRPMYKVIIANRAKERLDDVPRATGDNMARIISWLAENTDEIAHERLKGYRECNLYCGHYRVPYLLDRMNKMITIEDISKHDEVYIRL